MEKAIPKPSLEDPGMGEREERDRLTHLLQEGHHPLDDIQQFGVGVLEPVTHRDAPEYVEDGQVELARDANRLTAVS